MIRRLFCFLGVHNWQMLPVAPSWREGDDPDPGLWCVVCGKRGPRGPGDGLLVQGGRRAPDPAHTRTLAEVACG